jgi:hypothetical protein
MLGNLSFAASPPLLLILFLKQCLPTFSWAGLKLAILLFLPPECWNNRGEPLCLTEIGSLKLRFSSQSTEPETGGAQPWLRQGPTGQQGSPDSIIKEYLLNIPFHMRLIL